MRRRAQERPPGQPRQRVVLERGGAEEPFERDVDHPPEREVIDLDRAEVRGRDVVELGPLARIVAGPAVADRPHREAVRGDRPLDVAATRRAGHRRCLVGVRPVAHLEPTAAREELDVRPAPAQRVGDDRLVLHVSHPVAGAHDEHPWPAVGRAGPAPQAPCGALLGCDCELAQHQLHAFARVLLQPRRIRERHQRCCRGRWSNGRPVTIRQTPDQRPRPYAQWQMPSAASARCGATPGSVATRDATTTKPRR